jgi:hypothetical protein
VRYVALALSLELILKFSCYNSRLNSLSAFCSDQIKIIEIKRKICLTVDIYKGREYSL